MPTTLKRLHPDDLPSLHEIVVANDPFSEDMTLEQLKVYLLRADGFTIWVDGVLAGAILGMDFVPRFSMSIHIFVDESFHGEWATRKALRELFAFAFVELGLHRVTSVGIPFKTWTAIKMLRRLGFRECGWEQEALKTSCGELCDIIRFELLDRNCKWL